MLQFLDEKKGVAKATALTPQERSELEHLREDFKRLQEKKRLARKGSDASANEERKKKGDGSGSDEDVSCLSLIIHTIEC